MNRLCCGALLLSLGMATAGAVSADDQKDARKPGPTLAKVLQGSPENFIKHFDKDKDGYLSKSELPERLQAVFARIDKNGDGKLDKEEVAQMLPILRQRLGGAQPKAGNPKQVERMVANMLERLDTNKDGKISKEEAKGRPVGMVFDRFDANKDGYLDKDELRKVVEQMLANRNAQGPVGPALPGQKAAGPDFDALDKDADGRLTREELKGTPYAEHFNEIDTNKDGKIDRKEFAAYLKKQAR